MALSGGGSEMEVSMVDPESRKHVDGGRRSLSGRHFPARHAAVKLKFEGHFPSATFRSPCYNEDGKVFKEMAHFPTRDFPAKKLQEGLPERGFNSLSGGHFFEPRFDKSTSSIDKLPTTVDKSTSRQVDKSTMYRQVDNCRQVS